VTAPDDPTVTTVRTLTGAATADIDDYGIAALLDEEGGVVKLAAADVLELMAGRLLTVKADDISIDGSKQATALQARADRLRQQHYENDDFFFDTAATGSDPRFVGDGGYVLGSPGWGVL
jgi:hypothetical protein